jgi:hypothetical protein
MSSRLSPSSSGYKSQSQRSDTTTSATPSPTATPVSQLSISSSTQPQVRKCHFGLFYSRHLLCLYVFIDFKIVFHFLLFVKFLHNQLSIKY